MPHFLDDRDIDLDRRLALLEGAAAYKFGQRVTMPTLSGKQIAVVMQKPSLRTRVSFTVAVRRLGGDVIEVGSHNTKLGKGEAMEEWAGVLSRMVDGIVARVFGHDEVESLAKHSRVPVINALSDALHPCQGLADALTAWEYGRVRLGDPVSARTYFAEPHHWAYVGDGNNVAHSLLLTAASLGVKISIAAPAGHLPDAAIVESARAMHRMGRDGVVVTLDAREAVEGAEVVYTDTWVSMGQEGKSSHDDVIARFTPYRVDESLLDHAAPEAIVLHCLPAVPGEEITEAVLRGPRSRVLDQAENRLWTTMALLSDHVFRPE